MPERDYKVTITTEAKGDGAKKAADGLKTLGKDVQQTGQQMEGATTRTNKLVDALKKGTQAVPGLGFALQTLKNPFFALGGVIAITINWFNDLNEKIAQLQDAVGNGKIADQFKNLGAIMARSRQDAKALADELDRIANRPDTPAEQAQRQLADLERQLATEAAADEAQKTIDLAGVTDPVARAQIEARFSGRAQARERRKADESAALARSRQFREQDALREAQARLPAEQQALAQAEVRRDELLGLAALNTTDPAKLEALRKQIEEIDAVTANPLASPIAAARLAFQFGKPEDLIAHRATLADTLSNLTQGNQQAAILRETALGEFQSAQGRFNRFRQGLVGAQENVRTAGGESAAALAGSESLRSLAPIQAQASKATLDAAVQAELKAEAERLAKEIASLLGDIRRSVRRQTQSD